MNENTSIIINKNNYHSIQKINNQIETSNNNEDNEDNNSNTSEVSEIFNLNDSSTTYEQIKMIIDCSLPTISTLLMTVISMTIVMYFAGILSDRYKNDSIFAGISLASTFANLTFSSIMEGFSSAIETLSSQYNGAKKYSDVGLTLHQSIISLFVLSLPILVSWYYVDVIFISLGVNSDICLVTQEFLKIEIYSTPGEILILTYEKYLQSMGLMSPSMNASLVYNIFLFVLLHISINVYFYSYHSLAYTHNICIYLQLITLIYLTLDKKEVKRTLVYPTIELFSNITSFLSFGLSGCIMMCAEWWAYEILTIFASFLSSVALSSQSILLQLIVILFMFPLGIGISISAIIGNSIGSGSFKLAKSVGNLSFLVVFGLDLILSPLVYFYGYYYVKLFTTNNEVIQLSLSCLPIISIQLFIDGIQAIGSGVLRGLGHQSYGAYINIISYYLIALPFGWYFCFNKSYGIFGLFIGILIGSSIQFILILICIYYYISYDTSIQIIENDNNNINDDVIYDDLEYSGSYNHSNNRNRNESENGNKYIQINNSNKNNNNGKH